MSNHLFSIKMVSSICSRLDERDDNPTDDAGPRGLYDGFSETQTDSQVISGFFLPEMVVFFFFVNGW